MANLQISKESIGSLFSSMQGKKFIIPEYQREYSWKALEQCDTLWEDITDHFASQNPKDPDDYFLGTVVYYKNAVGNLEIIDGQQRVTSLFLLLRAVYKKLECVERQTAETQGLKSQIAPCIWDTHKVSKLVTDKALIHIESQVATTNDNKTFRAILEDGVSVDNKDNYSENYKFFQKKCDDYAQLYPMSFNEFCVMILEQCIVLPIECDSRETALIIFSTLNDRGLPLADSDIFKATIYSRFTGEDAEEKQKEFTDYWKILTEICDDTDDKLSINDVFRYYTHALRAKDGDKSKEVSLRKFYLKSDKNTGSVNNRLEDENLISNLMKLANFWRYIYIGKTPNKNGVSYVISDESRKWLHCLSWYPNEFWKYPTSVFFLEKINSEAFNSDSFNADFQKMLKNLLAFLSMKFIDKPTVNAIKDDIYQSCISLVKNNELTFKDGSISDVIKQLENPALIDQKMSEQSTSKFSKALILLSAYLHEKQTGLIDDKFEIEHIFPRKWQVANYNGWSVTEAQLYLERFGNKIALEKKLNIQANNGYFGQKKPIYKGSKISCAQDLSQYPKDDWVKEDIEAREEKFKSGLIDFFKSQLVN